jgi:hypothetical protein
MKITIAIHYWYRLTGTMNIDKYSLQMFTDGKFINASHSPPPLVFSTSRIADS